MNSDICFTMGELGVVVETDGVVSCTVFSWGGDLTVTEVAGRPIVLAMACAPAVVFILVCIWLAVVPLLDVNHSLIRPQHAQKSSGGDRRSGWC